MNRMIIHSRVGADGVLQLAVPIGKEGADQEVTVTIDPASPRVMTQKAPRPIIHIDPKSGFPYVECSPDAPSHNMTIRELIALEHETLIEEGGERIGLSHR